MSRKMKDSLACHKTEADDGNGKVRGTGNGKHDNKTNNIPVAVFIMPC